jgi:3-hydroxymyristoyl/3-hydroxydecanoyl-(acyl carrier protein) dehydratase
MYSRGFVIGKDHPALPGHFPGNPVVPGVILLDCVRQAVLDAYPGSCIAAIKWVKFLVMIRPDQRFLTELYVQNGDIKFECRIGDLIAVKGMLVLRKGETW